VLAGLVVLALAVFAVPAGRRVLRARVSPTLGQVLPRLLDVAQQPRKLALGIGGALLLSLSYILCLAASVAAFGRSVPARQHRRGLPDRQRDRSILPTRAAWAGGGALTAGLTAAGLPARSRSARAAVPSADVSGCQFRSAGTALNFLERQQAL